VSPVREYVKGSSLGIFAQTLDHGGVKPVEALALIPSSE
jgi:hypothetical protein